jgi:hypothetical protein
MRERNLGNGDYESSNQLPANWALRELGRDADQRVWGDPAYGAGQTGVG